MDQLKFTFKEQSDTFEGYLDVYLKKKPPDCILYSAAQGSSFKIHKELFSQTPFLRELLSSANCCNTLEILCPCSTEELAHLVNFLYDGEIHCENENDSKIIQENLEKIFGFPGVKISLFAP